MNNCPYCESEVEYEYKTSRHSISGGRKYHSYKCAMECIGTRQYLTIGRAAKAWGNLTSSYRRVISKAVNTAPPLFRVK